MRSLRIIVEETIQKVYDLDPENPEHQKFFHDSGMAVMAQSIAPVPEVLGKRAKKGATPIEAPIGLIPTITRKVYTGHTTLIMDEGVPFMEIKRTLTNSVQKPVKS